MMTFSELIDAVEVLMPKGIYSVSAELAQCTQYQSCAHMPAIKRTLEFKVWDGKTYHEGETAAQAYEKFKASRSPAVPTTCEPLMVDAHNVKTEVAF
jgi:hypothetical protein